MRRAACQMWMLAALPWLVASGASCNKVTAAQPSAARVCSIAAPAPANSRLHADGVKLRGGLGRVVFLRGVDAGGRRPIVSASGRPPLRLRPHTILTLRAAILSRRFDTLSAEIESTYVLPVAA